MFYSRRINRETQKIEVWECEWTNPEIGMAEKKFLRRIGNEEDFKFSHNGYSTANAICWAPSGTIGNIAVDSEETFGRFSEKSGNDAILPCQLIPAGKFRHGARRWYCKTHQTHWGTKADYAAIPGDDELRCSNHLMKMNYIIDPLVIEFCDSEEVGIWCSLPPALSSEPVRKRPPEIHVYKRRSGEKEKYVDKDFPAIICSYDKQYNLFPNSEINHYGLKVHSMNCD